MRRKWWTYVRFDAKTYRIREKPRKEHRERAVKITFKRVRHLRNTPSTRLLQTRCYLKGWRIIEGETGISRSSAGNVSPIIVHYPWFAQDHRLEFLLFLRVVHISSIGMIQCVAEGGNRPLKSAIELDGLAAPSQSISLCGYLTSKFSNNYLSPPMLTAPDGDTETLFLSLILAGYGFRALRILFSVPEAFPLAKFRHTEPEECRDVHLFVCKKSSIYTNVQRLATDVPRTREKNSNDVKVVTDISVPQTARISSNTFVPQNPKCLKFLGGYACISAGHRFNL
ncbi:hypothetical protein ARMSODRAFT_972797 [Armillaria solidipes]|uniref:Uncharacterized protein n=1 Tax=Armillaria solidipes TaxID=1076256 RepID=A0A2H3BT53_9AGAR|nr:hypothetical protein ARMSODRAFT_972797 [Armillaria solidipes]